jgi:hypothetical protein
MTMPWSECKKVALELQYHICPVCGKFLNGDYVGHHIRNKSQGGQDTVGNVECRHPTCERAMHELYPNGNFPASGYEPIYPHRKEKPAKKYHGGKPYRGQGRR